MDTTEFDKFADMLEAVGYVEASETILKLIDTNNDDEPLELDVDESVDLSDEDIERIDKFTRMLDRNDFKQQAEHLRKRVNTNLRRRRR